MRRTGKCLLALLLVSVIAGVALIYSSSFRSVSGFWKRNPNPDLEPVDLGRQSRLTKSTSTLASTSVSYAPIMYVEGISSTLPGHHESKSTKDSVKSSIAPGTSRTASTQQVKTTQGTTTKTDKKGHGKLRSTSHPKDKTDWRYFDPLYRQQSTRAKLNHDTPACNIPLLNPWDSNIMKFVKNIKTAPTKCNQAPPLTYIWNRTHIRINSSNEHFYDNGTASICQVSFINRAKNDKDLVWSEKLPLKPGPGLKIPLLEQYMFVRCGNSSGKGRYERVHVRFTVNPEQEAMIMRQKKNGRRLSVLLFYNDGIAHAMSRRVMNETYYYLRNEQGGISLDRYHTVGLNTFPNMIPYLTGKGDLEFDWDIRKKSMNLIPLIWNNFSNRSYVTGYMEDTTYSTFNYVKKGFATQPTDYYLKNVLNYIEKLGTCRNTTDKKSYIHQTMLDILDDFLTLHKDNNFFFWYFMNQLSHGNPFNLGRTDQDYYRFFKKHFDAGTFENTLLIFGSDHGARFGSFRNTALGRIEERLPLQLLVFPKWFKKEYKDIYEIMQYNVENALTTPFDMYRTLNDILDQKKEPLVHNRLVNGTLTRGLSLFGKIPMSRTCKDAGIPPNFCICRAVKPVRIGNKNVTESAAAALNHINNLLEDYKQICETLKLQKIAAAHYVKGKSNKKPYHDYFIKFVVEPGGAILEATVRNFGSSPTYTVQGDIGRINLYGTTSKCIDSDLLRNYCYCKHQV